MQQLIDRLKREPLLTRAGLAAALNVLRVAGVIDTAAADNIENAIVGLVDVVLVLAARRRVTPVAAPRDR